MKIAIIDADLIGRSKHRFPNLACMKLSGYHKELGDEVVLKTDYDWLMQYDKVYISKVFTDTVVPDEALIFPNVTYGGTGFFYDKAPPLPAEVEHHMPDYHLYDNWVEQQIQSGKPPINFKYYKEYSIGFLTRGCFRQCSFCVNKNYKQVQPHSPVLEFLDPSKKKICLLDDNFLGCPNWKELLLQLQATKKPFQFKQGLDVRLLTDEKCELLFNSKYDGEFLFSFDNIADAPLIEEKLKLIRRHTNKEMKFYCLCAFDRKNEWNADFWQQDIFDLMSRIEILMKYKCLPYIMRFNRYEESPYRTLYIAIAWWCNQPRIFKKQSLRQFAEIYRDKGNYIKHLLNFVQQFPSISHFYDLKF